MDNSDDVRLKDSRAGIGVVTSFGHLLRKALPQVFLA